MSDHGPAYFDDLTGSLTLGQSSALAGVSEHPAMTAWCRLSLRQPKPGVIERLQKKKKGCVYLLRGVGPRGADVVGKVSTPERIARERAIYERVLPRLGMTGVEYYGHVEEPDVVGCWIFVGNAGGVPYSPTFERHRVAAAQWLARLHVTAAGLVPGLDGLTGRRAEYYLSQLRGARETLVSCLGNPALSIDDVALVRDVIRQCDVTELRWAEVRGWAEAVPATFVHGDFAPKNMRVRAGDVLTPYDWGSAGWGSVAADLAQAGAAGEDSWDYWANVDLGTYRDAVGEVWRGVTARDVRMSAAVGKLFRCLVCVCLDAPSFGYDYVERAVRDLAAYRAGMAGAARELGWGA